MDIFESILIGLSFALLRGVLFKWLVTFELPHQIHISGAEKGLVKATILWQNFDTFSVLLFLGLITWLFQKDLNDDPTLYAVSQLAATVVCCIVFNFLGAKLQNRQQMREDARKLK